MSAESSKRSNLIDVTYQQLHSILAGQLEGSNTSTLLSYLNPRSSQLKNLSSPFGQPNPTSKQKVSSGSVTLPDDVVIRVEETDKEFVFALSAHFNIDEIQALVLLRSFLYNQGLSTADSGDNKSIVDELVEAITPFYFSERLHLLRILPPLFRAKESPGDVVCDVANEFIPTLIPDGSKFAASLLDEYLKKTQEKLPEHISDNPRLGSKWAKQGLKEQLLILEVLFWTMWGSTPCSGTIVLAIYKAAYQTNLGSLQKNSHFFLDEESTQLQQDIAALWILITIEVLELESLADGNGVEISTNPENPDIYTASPESLTQLHALVTTNSNSQHACAYLGWAFVLSRISASAKKLKEVPDSYRAFLQQITDPVSSKDREAPHASMSRTVLDPGVGFFGLLLDLLTKSPLFVTSVAWKTGSSVTDPNAVAYRSVLKGLLIALVELVPVELIPDMDAFHEIWMCLFGRSEPPSVSGICQQYWQADWHHAGIARRGVIDVARARFPVQPRPLIRLLRAMTATGFLDTDPLSTADHANTIGVLTDERDVCQRYVFFYLERLVTYTQVIHIAECTGPNALYERVHERYGSSSTPGGLTYANVRPIRLPGGTILPAKSKGNVLSNTDGEYLVVCWQFEHSGWKVLLDLLTDYVNKRRVYSGISGVPKMHKRAGDKNVVTKSLEDVGVEMNSGGDDELVKDILDLFRSLFQDNPTQSEQLVQALESGDPVVSHTTTEAQPPDLVQLTTLVLEEALSRSREVRGAQGPQTELITSTISVLASMLSLPQYSSRVWLYIRSTSALFGQEKNVGFSTVALAAERNTGHYTMTLSLLHLVQSLFREASSTVLVNDDKLQQLKEDVLLRAIKFVYTEIWVEHLNWRYAQIGDRFEIGRRISSLFVDVLRNAPPTIEDRPFKRLSQLVADILLFRATTSALNPIISTISNGGAVLETLYSSRRYGDARCQIFLLESQLALVRLVLNIKAKAPAVATQLSLLESALCHRSADSAAKAKAQPIEVLMGYVKARDLGAVVPLESIRVLTSLCSSFSLSQTSPPSIIAHLSNPENTVASLVRIIQHPYDDPELRRAVWHFMAVAVDKEPALAGLLISGKFRSPADFKGKGKSKDDEESNQSVTAMQVARDMLVGAKELWEVNPELLSSISRFVDLVWQHAHEHESALDEVRKDDSFWASMVTLGCEELGPVPDYRVEEFVVVDGRRRSDLHQGVVAYSHRATAKAHALHVFALDIEIHLSKKQDKPKPESFLKLEPYFQSEEQLTELISEAFPSSYDPEIYDSLTELLKDNFPLLSIEQLRWQEPVVECELGDEFTFSTCLFTERLQAAPEEAVPYVEEAEKQLHSLNLNLSLVHVQGAHLESWRLLLTKAIPYLRGNSKVRPTILQLACAVSADVSKEKRSGDMMASIHGSRLSLLQSLLEVAWFQDQDSPAEVTSFVDLVRNLDGIILNEVQTVASSFMGAITVPFHRTLLQIVYFCARFARSLNSRHKALNAQQRLHITAMLDAALSMVIDALRVVFVAARSRADPDLDKDLELLVAVFERCTRPDLQLSTIHWLTKCQELDVIKASLELFVHIDLVGLSDLPSLLTRKHAMYTPYLLLFHIVLSCIPSTAARLASDGLLSAYSNNQLSAALSAGKVDVMIPELPAERSPAHQAYCWMLSTVTGIVSAVGSQMQFFNAEVCGFIQLYGDQISRTLSWTMNEPLTTPLLDEMEQVISLFFSIADTSPLVNPNTAVTKVLEVFSAHSLLLLQQLNYALTHPNHLSSILEPITVEERNQLEKEAKTEDVAKRPFVQSVVRRLFALANRVVSTLVCTSRAMTILLEEPEDWPLHEALVVPHSKIVPGEPASIGTLTELANCALDVLKEQNNKPPPKLLAPSGATSTAEPHPEAATLARLVESVLLYSVTQLAMSVRKPEAQLDASDMEMDDQPADGQLVQVKERTRRPKKSLGDRLRRGMTGEMASDLQSLLTKAKPILQKTNESIEKNPVDLTSVLLTFLREHVGSV